MKSFDRHIQELKDLMEKEGGKEVTWEEASVASRNLAGFVQLMFDCWREEQRWKKSLENSPKGFQLEGVGRNCSICGNASGEGGSWYDKWGIKCFICKASVDRKEIPASLGKNTESWYTKYDLENSFNIKGPVLKRWIKNGIVKVRNVTRENGHVHAQLFLIKDNKDTLPPKKMVKSQLVKEVKGGQTWHRSEPWYRFVNPQEHLKGYKIMDYLRVTHEEQVEKTI